MEKPVVSTQACDWRIGLVNCYRHLFRPPRKLRFSQVGIPNAARAGATFLSELATE